MKRHCLSRDPRNGNYYARIQRGGVLKKFVFGPNQRKSEQKLRQLEDEIESGKKSFAAVANLRVDKSEPQDLPIKELVTLYLDWVRAHRAPRTHETAFSMLRPFVEAFGDCMVSDLNTLTLSKYYAWVRTELCSGENAGNHHMRMVKTMLRWGEGMEICICPVRRFPAIREAPARTKKFTDDELVLLLDKATPDFRDLIVFGVLTGLRPQELRGLRREHIRKSETCWSVVLERHKTSKSAEIALPRCVPLSPEAVTIILRQIETHPESVYIFLNAHGNPYTKDGLRQRLNRTCKSAGIEQKPPYALRHYFGTKQAANGLNQTVLAQLMGHTKLHTTSRYIASVPEYHQKAVAAMEKSLSALLESASLSAPVECKTDAQPVPELSRLRVVK